MDEKRIVQRLRLFERALNGYTEKEPLSRYLTRFYRENRQMGSTDRRITSRYCYNFFRIGRAFTHLSMAERLALSEYLCETDSELLAIRHPKLYASIHEDIDKKIATLRSEYGDFLDQVFPFAEHLSSEIEVNSFVKSLFKQPHLYIRAKRDKVDHVLSELERHHIDFTFDGNTTITLPNGQNLQHIKAIEGHYEVQDLSSQRTIAFFDIDDRQSWWDCCAGSGGKSLMLLDRCLNVDLTVSDVRPSILRNLDERFQKAGVPANYNKKILDLSAPVSHLMGERTFDRILVDAPCSGSGTWGRTPEMISQFSEEQLAEFSHLQKRIIRNVVPHLKTGGQLIYITCSVFFQENEDIAAFVAREFGLKPIHCSTIKGYENRADSMFIATFAKP